MLKSALVVFIGNESDYKIGCDEKEYQYCRDCDEADGCTKATSSLFTDDRLYKAYFVEYWQGVRNSLHIEGNDGKIHDFVPLEDFEIVLDLLNLLNDYEATVRCITHDYDEELFDLNYGKTYKAIGRDKDGMYLVMDESMDCYFYPAECFEIVEDAHEILSKESVYYSFQSGLSDDEGPDWYAAHRFSNNNKPYLEQDKVCGCFYCCEIFPPSEIKEYLINDSDCDKEGTALCPYCDIDSVIGEGSGYPITKKFLKEMHEHWFNDGEPDDDEDASEEKDHD